MPDFSDKKFRSPRRNADNHYKRPPITDEIQEIDRNICRLLLKRYNLLEKIRKNGRLLAEDEKKIRESWQKEATAISRDPEFSSSFFTMLQNISFRPRPVNSGSGESLPGPMRREAFNLAPPHLPLQLQMPAPLSSRLSRIWLYMASRAGQAMRLEPILAGNPIMNFITTLERLGASINRTLDNAAVLPGEPLAAPDTVIHVDNNEFNFYLFLAHYLGRPSRVKFNASSPLTLVNLSRLADFLPTLGSRMISVVPKSCSLPARFECSGMLPAGVDYPANLPAMFALALGIASMFYEHPFALNLSQHPEKQDIIEELRPILEACGAAFQLDNFTLNMEACSPVIPKEPPVPMENGIAAYLLAFAEPLRGDVRLKGMWQNSQKEANLWNLLINAGFAWTNDSEGVSNENSTILNKFCISEETLARFSPLPSYATPLLLSLGACACLSRGETSLPACLLDLPDSQDFLSAANLTNNNGKLEILKNRKENPVWNAPNAAWAMSLALAACANHLPNGFKLGNPGVVMDWWSGFWNFYNGLPVPQAKSAKASQAPEKKNRRIRTECVATPREIREEDWDR